jgi:uroporphyrinogen III methyltransferase/synthase
MKGMAGRTVVVTRPRPEGEAFARALAVRGARPVFFPTIEIHAVDDFTVIDRELAQLGGYDWIVFTSAYGVAHTWSRLHEVAITLPGSVHVAAIGPATARALVRHGVQVHAVPQEYRGTALPAAMGDLRGRRVLLPIADIGREETAQGLRDAGAAVTALTIYRTLPADADREGLKVLRAGADAVTFTSPSTVHNFAALVGAETTAMLEHAAVACIGPSTADAARSIGVKAPVVGTPYTTDGLAAALDDHFATGARMGGRA